MSDKTYMRNMRSFKELLDTCARDFGDVHFMEYKVNGGVEAKTYIELKTCADAVSRFLESKGLKGCHAALVGGASFHWVAAFMGIVDTGSAAVPLARATAYFFPTFSAICRSTSLMFSPMVDIQFVS